jgi:large repetitive protein
MRTWLVAMAVCVGACGGGGASGECTDGLDNDADGLIDNADPGCPVNGDSESPDPDLPECGDAVDNDSDGLTDFPDDPGCDGPFDNDEYNQARSACRDGIDNDDDGLIDFPNDPGCFLSLEDDESDDCPNGPSCPKCANGIDDDGDGLIDYGIGDDNDLGCDRAADDDEYNAEPGTCGAVTLLPLPADGIATGEAMAETSNELISNGCYGSGQETVYTINLTEKRALWVTTDFVETTLDTVVYVRGDCRMPGTELGCDDDSNGYKSTLLVEAGPGPWFIIVDAHHWGSSGNYKLQVIEYLPEGAECDPVASECAPGLVCRFLDGDAPTETCEQPECNDGLDNDDDGLSDFPNDPGCTAANDNTEGSDDCESCPGSCSMCPACGNGADDDGDDQIDYPADPGCLSAADTTEPDECIPGVPVTPLPDSGVSNTTVGSASTFNGSCTTVNQPEDVWSYRLQRDLRSLTFSTVGSTFDTATYVRFGTCGLSSAEIACADPTTGGEAINLTDPAQGNYYIFVDGQFGSGAYVLNVSGVIPGGDPCVVSDTQFVCESGYVCQAGTCEPTECNDGVGNGDGDGLTDYPLDPGCSSISDDDEADDCGSCPSCTMCPQCGNGSDDDSDTDVDYPDDVGCAAAGDNVEDDCPGEDDGIVVLADDQATGTTVGLTNDFQPSCVSPATGPERVYMLETAGALQTLTVNTIGSTLNTVVNVKQSECTTTDLGCDNDSAGAGDSLVTLNNLSPGQYFIMVDGVSGTSGTYTLNVHATVRAGEACDPALVATGLFSCAAGTYCDGTICAPTPCSNGVDDDSPADGEADYPDDPGCTSLDDLDEADDCDDCPSCTMCPACSNGVDDDTDSFTDYGDDAGCSFAADDLESNCDEEDTGVLKFPSSPQTGTTVGGINDLTPSCSASSTAPDRVYELVVPGNLTTLTVNTLGSAFDTVLAIKPTLCSNADLSCNDDYMAMSQSQITLTNVAAGYYLIAVDGFQNNSGAYTLNVSGTIATGQACDPAQTFLTCQSPSTCSSGTCQ